MAEAYDLIELVFPAPDADRADRELQWFCPRCVHGRSGPLAEVPVIDRRRINPTADLWATRSDGVLVSDRIRAILAVSCPDQLAFWPVSDCTRPAEVLPGYFLARPLSTLVLGGMERAAEVACTACGRLQLAYKGLPAQVPREAWDGKDLIAGPLLASGTEIRRPYYASRRLMLLLHKASVKGAERHGPTLDLAGDRGPTHHRPDSWAEHSWAHLPTERTFRPPPPDREWMDRFCEALGPPHVGAHPRALQAWQHGKGQAIPPSYRSLLRKADGLAFETSGKSSTGRPIPEGPVTLHGLAGLGAPSFRRDAWEVPSMDHSEEVWDGLAFARMAEGTTWAFDLSRPTSEGEFPVFRYDPGLARPVEFFDHFVDWLQEHWPGQRTPASASERSA